MIDADLSSTHDLEAVIRKMDKQIKRLRKRLLEKIEYEAEMLKQTGATGKYLETIRRKDAAALKED